ncbi:MAG: hypothetical protein A2049_10435 [Elusimicrobia bacterium GWA2_62_23]|nr:MAG: hypothetical protein A2049_10435 [Elusimicrobia bacterium GWA2_62_23]
MVLDSSAHRLAYNRFRAYLDASYVMGGGKSILGLSVGYPQPGEFPLPKVILKHLAVEVDGKERPRAGYGWEMGAQPLREALVDFENLLHGTRYGYKNICIVAGASYGFNRVVEALFERPGTGNKQIILVGPTFFRMTARVGRYAELLTVTGEESNDFQVTTEQLLCSVTERTRAIFLVNPSNPTYKYYPPSFFEQVVPELEKRGIYLVIDESGDAFHFGKSGARLMCYPPVIHSPNVIRIVTASKKYLLAEYRIGYVLADEAFLTDKVYGLNKLVGDDIGNAPLAANEAWTQMARHEITLLSSERCNCSPDCDFESVMRANTEKMKQLYSYSVSRLKAMGQVVNIIEPDCNFNITFNIRDTVFASDFELFSALLNEHKVSLLPCSGLGVPEEKMYFRLTYGINRQVLTTGLDMLSRFMHKYRAAGGAEVKNAEE